MEGLIDSVRGYPCLRHVHLKEYKDLPPSFKDWSDPHLPLLRFSSSTPTAANEK